MVPCPRPAVSQLSESLAGCTHTANQCHSAATASWPSGRQTGSRSYPAAAAGHLLAPPHSRVSGVLQRPAARAAGCNRAPRELARRPAAETIKRQVFEPLPQRPAGPAALAGPRGAAAQPSLTRCKRQLRGQRAAPAPRKLGQLKQSKPDLEPASPSVAEPGHPGRGWPRRAGVLSAAPVALPGHCQPAACAHRAHHLRNLFALRGKFKQNLADSESRE